MNLRSGIKCKRVGRRKGKTNNVSIFYTKIMQKGLAYKIKRLF